MSSILLGKWISLLYRYGQIYINKELEPYNIGRGQFLFLIRLYNNEGLSQDDLAQNLNIDKGTTARALRKLEKAGYIYKKPNKTNLRANQVFLTQKAKDFEPHLYTILESWTDIVSADMTEDEIERAFALLTKMTANATAHISKDR